MCAKMAAQTTPIDELTDKMQPWDATITVQEKLQSIQSTRSPTKFQKFVFSDDGGIKVEAIIFDSDIERMGSKLQVFKKYRISNAHIRPLDEKYWREGIKIQWVISSKTVIQEVTEQQNMLHLDCTYTKFDDLRQFLDDKTKPIDIIAVVVDVLPIKVVSTPNGKSTVQKFVLINEGLQSVFLSMWNQMLDVEGKQIIDALRTFPVIICRRLRASYYNGVELTTFFDTAVLVNPPEEDAVRLKKWVEANDKLLNDFVRQKLYLQNEAANLLQQKDNITLIGNLLSTQKFAFLKVQLKFEYLMQRFWYMACQKCYSSTAAAYASEYNCNACGENQLAQPRCRLEVELTDETGAIKSCLFGEQAEEILGFDALDAMTHTHQKINLELTNVHKELQHKLFFVHIKQAKLRNDGGSQRYSVVSIVDSNKKETTVSLPLIESGTSSSLRQHNQTSATETTVKARRSLKAEFAESSKDKDEGNSSVDERAAKKPKS